MLSKTSKVKYRRTPCAAKLMHELLLDPGNEEVRDTIQKYQRECQLMAGLRHPNITQFLGLCFLESSRLPLLIMEKLEMSVDDFLECCSNIPLPVKLSILTDTCSGLVYLHSMESPIVHRDLTTRNIHLTSSLSAKIIDLGNSHMVNMKSGQLARTLSKQPGALVYMPPETLNDSHRYEPSLDLFSFGRLSRYTLTQNYSTSETQPYIQIFPDELLAAADVDPNNPGHMIGRTEVEHHEVYMNDLKSHFNKTHHTVVELVSQCLHTNPQQRPSSKNLFERLYAVQAAVEQTYGKIGKEINISNVLVRKEMKIMAKEIEEFQITLNKKGCIVMSGPDSVYHWMSMYKSFVVKENPVVPEFSKAAENPEDLEQPELFIDYYNDTLHLFAEHGHDCNEPTIVPKKLPDPYVTKESSGERVVEEENEQELVQSEDPELVSERILDCTESEMLNELIAEIDNTPRPVEEPSLQLKFEEDEQNFPSQDTFNLPVVNNKAKYLPPKDFINPTKKKSNSHLQSSRKHYGLTTNETSSPMEGRVSRTLLTFLRSTYPSSRWKGYHWLLILLPFCLLINNATGLQEQRSELNLTNRNTYEILSIIFDENRALRIYHNATVGNKDIVLHHTHWKLRTLELPIRDMTQAATDENDLTDGYGDYTEETKTKCWSKLNDCRKYEECQQSIDYEVIFLYTIHILIPIVCALLCYSALLMTLILLLLVVVITRKTHCYKPWKSRCCKQRLGFLCSNHVLHARLSLELKKILCVCAFMILIPPCGAHDPAPNVVIQNGSKSYECFYEGAIAFEWQFNSTTITAFNAGVDIYNLPPYGFLILNPIPLSWNNTKIQCLANLGGNGSILVVQDILYVQGVPAPVHNMTYFLKGEILTVSWVPSFKLNLTNDFTSFCVQLYNHATDNIQGIQCGIQTHNYSASSDLKNLSCGNYSVEVIAQNIVGNSAPSSLRIWNKKMQVSDIVVTALNNHTGCKMVQLFMVMDICFSYTKLWFGNSNLQNSDNSQSDIFQCFLDEDKMFEVFLEFNNLQFHSNSSEITISTFDLIETIVNLIDEGRYLIKSSFVANSNARGVLYAIMFIDDSDNEDYSRSLYLLASLEFAMQGIERNIPNGKYHLLSYDIDSNISIVNYPANISMIVITNSNYKERQNNNGNCTLQQKIKKVNFSCHCSERDLYHVILQNSSTSVIMIYTLSCLEQLSMKLDAGQYHIIVFYENGTTIMANASPYYSELFTVNDTDSNTVTVSESEAKLIVIGISLMSPALVVMVITIIVIIFWRKRLQNKRSYYPTHFCEMDPDDEKKGSMTNFDGEKTEYMTTDEETESEINPNVEKTKVKINFDEGVTDSETNCDKETAKNSSDSDEGVIANSDKETAENLGDSDEGVTANSDKETAENLSDFDEGVPANSDKETAEIQIDSDEKVNESDAVSGNSHPSPSIDNNTSTTNELATLPECKAKPLTSSQGINTGAVVVGFNSVTN